MSLSMGLMEHHCGSKHMAVLILLISTVFIVYLNREIKKLKSFILLDQQNWKSSLMYLGFGCMFGYLCVWMGLNRGFLYGIQSKAELSELVLS